MTTAPETADATDGTAESRRRARAEYALLTRTCPVYDFPFSAVAIITGPDHAAVFDDATDWMGTLDGIRERDSLTRGYWLLDAAAASASGLKPATEARRLLRMDPDLVGVRSADADTSTEVASVLLDCAMTGHAVVISSETDVLDRDLAAVYGTPLLSLDDVPRIPPRLLFGQPPGIAAVEPGRAVLTFASGSAQFFDEPNNRFIAVTRADITLLADTDDALDPRASRMTLSGRVVKESNWEPGKRRAEVADLNLGWLPGAAWSALIARTADTGVTITEDAYVTATTGGLA